MSTKTYRRFEQPIFISLIVLLSQVSTGCSKNTPSTNEAVVSNAVVSYTLTATSANNSSGGISNVMSLQRTDGINTKWISATAFISETRIEAKINGKDFEIKNTPGRSFPILSIPAVLGDLNIPAGNYDEISFKMKLDAGGSRKSLELKGSITLDANTWDILFSTNESIELRQEYEHVMIKNTSLHNALSSFDLKILSEDITPVLLNTAVKLNGVIIISSELNSELYKIFIKKLHDLDHNVEFH